MNPCDLLDVLVNNLDYTYFESNVGKGFASSPINAAMTVSIIIINVS